MAKQPERILLVTEEFPPDVGGAGSVAYQNAKALSQWCNVDVLTRQRSGEVKEEKPFRLLEVSSLPKVWAFSLGYALRNMNLSEYDSIILNDVGAAFVAGAVLEQEDLSKSIVYTHGSDLEQVLGSPSLMYRLIRVPHFYRRALRQCHRLVAVSREQASRLGEVEGVSGLDEKSCVLYAGVDLSLFKRQPSVRNESSEIQLLTVGRVEASKGFPRKYEIFQSMVASGCDVHWMVVGAGSYLSRLTQKVQQDGLGDRVTCVGAVPRSELAAFYSAADVFWLLSDKEAFGLVYIEANACGCPVIARRGSGVQEAVQDGITGFSVDSVEECIELIQRREYERLDQSDLFQHAEQFSLQRKTTKLLSLLRSMGKVSSKSSTNSIDHTDCVSDTQA